MRDSTTDSDTVRPALSQDGHIPARDLHPGDVVQEHDWPLHVCGVTLDPAAVTVAVTEFEFPLHYAADAEVHVLA
ncbi:MAG TPA: hypothetical protein VGL21_08235 [Jatrophihabitantaceae bacterium]|jgi:hypothetical protein